MTSFLALGIAVRHGGGADTKGVGATVPGLLGNPNCPGRVSRDSVGLRGRGRGVFIFIFCFLQGSTMQVVQIHSLRNIMPGVITLFVFTMNGP